MRKQIPVLAGKTHDLSNWCKIFNCWVIQGKSEGPIMIKCIDNRCTLFQKAKINGSGKYRFTSIISPEIKDNNRNATTGAVEKYFVKLFIMIK